MKNEALEAAVAGWQKLADRSDLIGKKIAFTNRMVSDMPTIGTIRSISVEDGWFVIAADEFDRGEIRFKIDEERDPHQVGDTIFCDLDDNHRQIQISTA